MKHIIKYLKTKFSFLIDKYCFKVIEEYKANTYFYLIWSNQNINIKICYEFTDNNPIGIYVYDVNDKFMYRHQYFYKEFAYNQKEINNYKNYKELIDYAADKFYNMIKTKIVKIK